MPKDIEREIESLYRKLYSELDCFRQNNRFYSIRELMRRNAVSRRIVEKALKRLELEGEISIEPTCGIFVSAKRSRNSFAIASVHCDWPAEYWVNLDSALEQEIRKRHGLRFFRAFFESSSGSGYMEYLQTLQADAILLTLPPQHFSAREIAALLEWSTPVIFLENNLLCDGINAIDSQPENSGMLAADCLIRNGHRKLALILSEPWSIGDNRRNEGFLNYARLKGIDPLVIDCEVQPGEASCAKTHEQLLIHLKKHGPDFTGCFTMSDYSALGVISAIKEYGLRVPEDISVIGDGGVAGSVHYSPSLTTVAHDLHGMARAIADGALELAAGGRFGIRVVPSRLIERKSVQKYQPVTGESE